MSNEVCCAKVKIQGLDRRMMTKGCMLHIGGSMVGKFVVPLKTTSYMRHDV